MKRYENRIKAVLLPALLAMASMAHPAQAAELEVLATGAVSGAFKTLVADYEKQTGHHLKLSWGPSMGQSHEAIPVRIKGGQSPDVLIMVSTELDRLIREQRFTASARLDVAQSGVGVGVKAGSAAPDISDVDKLRQALLAAPSVAYSEGASGNYIHNVLLKRLGLEQEVAAKRRLVPGKQLVGEVLAEGGAALGLQQISELRVVPGVHYVGPLPDEVQKISVLTAAASAKSTHAAEALDFLRFLGSPGAVAAIERSGLDQPSVPATVVERRLVRNGPVQIEVLSQGQGPAIVMLPSLGRSVRDFDQVAARLASQGFRVIRPEPRGIGASQGPLEGLTLHDFAADVAAVCDAEKTGAAVILGHAWGSQPARMLAVDRPELVKGLIMAAASAGKLPPGSTEKPYGRLRDAIDGSGNPALPQAQRLQYLKQAFFAPGHDPSEWLDGWYEANHHAEAHARNVTPIDSYFSGGSTAPILDLQGEFDAVVVKDVMKAYLGDRVQVEVVKGAGHAMFPERPAPVTDAVARFARQLNAAH